MKLPSADDWPGTVTDNRALFHCVVSIPGRSIPHYHLYLVNERDEFIQVVGSGGR
jgi:hypothetical protein